MCIRDSISGDVRTGVGLLILFGIMSVIRQFSEPHIIGTALGIHPLLALIAVYCGMELFGLCGLILDVYKRQPWGRGFS